MPRDGALAGRPRARVYLAGVPRVRQLRRITLLIIAYLIFALGWWSVLLNTKNRDAFEAKAALLELGLVAEGRIGDRAELIRQPEYRALERSYRRQGNMIIAEALVLCLSLGAAIYFVNRTARKEVEAARQQRNFLLSITHELKSPLAGIRLALETMRRRVLPEEMRATLTTRALDETTRLTTLVEDLLLSARLDTQYEPNLEPIDLGVLGRDWVERMAAKYPEVAFALELDGEEFSVLADRYGINSVLSNLLENAVKYLGDGSSVKVVVCERGRDVHIEVRDDGLGISDEEKARVFDKFYRIGNEDTRSTKGTGLGLYIVHEVIRAHKGSVSVRDNVPRGTVFAICLPFGEST